MLAKNKFALYCLGAILFLSFALRIYNINSQDILGDEAADSFRSVGYLDYLGTNFQTQPIDWYKNVTLPWWTKLSFHDDPPFGFLTAHIFFRIFGDFNLVAKLPAIFWGVFSTLLIYLIMRKFSPPTMALLAAFLFAASGPSIWIFRSSLLEPLLLGMLLLNIYCFLLFLDNKKYFFLFGLTLGLVALTKYTGVFILPVYFCYLLIYDRKILCSSKLWLAFLLATLVFSPVIIYNFYLYQARAHFDLQFAYLFHQSTPEWIGQVGKTQEGFASILKNLVVLYGLPELILLVLILFSFLSKILYNHYLSSRIPHSNIRPGLLRRGSLEDRFSGYAHKPVIFVFLYLFFLTLMLVKIGAAPRFLALYLPAFIALESYAIHFLWNRNFKFNFLLKILIIIYLSFNIWFAYQINFVKNYDYGVSKLDQYFTEEFQGKESGAVPQSDNQHLNKVIADFASQRSDLPRHLSLIVYNDNITIDILEWIYYRYFFYHSIPTMYVENFVSAVQGGDKNLFKDFTIYFVQSATDAPKNIFKKDKKAGDQFEASLIKQGKKPEKVILGKDDQEMFRIYKFNFSDY